MQSHAGFVTYVVIGLATLVVAILVLVEQRNPAAALFVGFVGTAIALGATMAVDRRIVAHRKKKGLSGL